MAPARTRAAVRAASATSPEAVAVAERASTAAACVTDFLNQLADDELLRVLSAVLLLGEVHFEHDGSPSAHAPARLAPGDALAQVTESARAQSYMYMVSKRILCTSYSLKNVSSLALRVFLGTTSSPFC